MAVLIAIVTTASNWPTVEFAWTLMNVRSLSGRFAEIIRLVPMSTADTNADVSQGTK